MQITENNPRKKEKDKGKRFFSIPACVLSVAIQHSVCSAFFCSPAVLVLDVHKKWNCHPAEMLTYCKLLWNQNGKMNILWHERLKKKCLYRNVKQNVFGGNETIQLVGCDIAHFKV